MKSSNSKNPQNIKENQNISRLDRILIGLERELSIWWLIFWAALMIFGVFGMYFLIN